MHKSLTHKYNFGLFCFKTNHSLLSISWYETCKSKLCYFKVQRCMFYSNEAAWSTLQFVNTCWFYKTEQKRKGIYQNAHIPFLFLNKGQLTVRSSIQCLTCEVEDVSCFLKLMICFFMNLFKCFLKCIGYTAQNGVRSDYDWCIVKDGIEAVMTYSRVLSQRLHGRSQKAKSGEWNAD